MKIAGLIIIFMTASLIVSMSLDHDELERRAVRAEILLQKCLNGELILETEPR